MKGTRGHPSAGSGQAPRAPRAFAAQRRSGACAATERKPQYLGENEGRGDTLRSFGYAPFDSAQDRQDKLGSGQAPRAPRTFAAQRRSGAYLPVSVGLTPCHRLIGANAIAGLPSSLFTIVQSVPGCLGPDVQLQGHLEIGYSPLTILREVYV